VPTPSARHLDYVAHLARESAQFAHALDAAGPEDPVPSCPGWTADDLLWHLGEVQWFWGAVVADRVDRQAAESLKPARPASRAELVEFYLAASSRLGSALAAAAPEDPAWTWADDKTVGFIRRRQAHEALIHRVDAELTAGSRTVMDRQLSSDGIDEVLMIMYGGELPPWGQFAADGARTLRIQADDTGDSWFVELGQFSGTDPEDQKVYDRPGIQVTRTGPVSQAAATIEGTGPDLDCWLWHRPGPSQVQRSGDQDVLASFDSLIAAGVD
jgi:uncharacterized protein (TIGR03083 family)